MTKILKPLSKKNLSMKFCSKYVFIYIGEIKFEKKIHLIMEAKTFFVKPQEILIYA